MNKRLQKVNGDTVLDITTEEPVKTRISEKDLLRRKAYLTGAISRFQTQLDDVNAKLTQLYDEAKKA